MNVKKDQTKVAEQIEKNEKDQAGQAQFLSFTLGDESYAVDILSVQEIRGWEPVSRVPNVPVYEKGVINLRGAIVPIIDLREKFGMQHQGYSALTVVIILQTDHRRTGVVVDAVSDVLDVDERTIQQTPNFGSAISTEYITGLISVHDKMVMLLDVKRLLHLESLEQTNKKLLMDYMSR